MNIQGNDFCLKWRFFLLKKKKSMELEYIKLELYLVLEFREIEFPSRESCLLNKLKKKTKKKHHNGTRVYKTHVPQIEFHKLNLCWDFFFHMQATNNQKHTETANNQK